MASTSCWISADPCSFDLDWDRRLPCLGFQRHEESLIREQGRVDAASQVPQVLENIGRLRLQALKRLCDLRRLALGGSMRKAELYAERDELLLRAVVDVALDPPALLVVRRHEPLK